MPADGIGKAGVERQQLRLFRHLADETLFVDVGEVFDKRRDCDEVRLGKLVMTFLE